MPPTREDVHSTRQSFLVFLIILINIKSSFNQLDYNKKNHVENTKKPLDASLILFIYFKSILDILLCFKNIKIPSYFQLI
jgi:hypothetical protein